MADCCTALLACPAYLKRHRASTTPSCRIVWPGTSLLLTRLHKLWPIVILLLFAIPLQRLSILLFRLVEPGSLQQGPGYPIPLSCQCFGLAFVHFTAAHLESWLPPPQSPRD